MKKIKYTILLLIIARHLYAQDFHLSQYDAASQYLNPALTGMYCGVKGDYRFYADYRSQWATSSLKPYSSAYLAFDMPGAHGNRIFGFGGYLVNNNSGIGDYKSINVMLSAAYNITGQSNGIHYLTTGLQMGILHRYFDPNSFTYDVQYSEQTGGFDSSIPSQENILKTNLTGLDVNYGIFYKYAEAGRRAHPFAGLSIHHVTQPKESFTEHKAKTPMRFNFHGGCDVDVNETIKLDPRFLYMYQAGATELNIGLLMYNKIRNTPYSGVLQCDYRVRDAMVLGIGIKQNENIFRISYDINTSSLNPYLAGRGSWEFSLIYTGKKNRPAFY